MACKHCDNQGQSQPASSVATYAPEITSLILMITGMALNHSEAFMRVAEIMSVSQTAIMIAYYIAAAIPVGYNIAGATVKAWMRLDFFNEFSLMMMACIGAFIIGEYPEAVAILLFYSVGEKLEESAADRTRNSIRSLLGKLPSQVTIVHDDGSRTIAEPESVAIGSLIAVKPGERVALDGTLAGRNHASFDTSAITGESLPVDIAPHAEVSSGSMPVDREVIIKVTRPYADSSMSRIMAMIEEAAQKKSTTETLLRKITRFYTPAVILAAILLFVVPLAISAVKSDYFDWQLWLQRSLILLVCSCPCALVVSIPLSYFAAIGNASRLGMLFKGSRYLDALRSVDTLILDKTGTITTGQFHVSSIRPAPPLTAGDLLALAAALDMHSSHPLATAIVAETKTRGITIPEAHDTLTVDHGIMADINGRKVVVGSRKLLEAQSIDVPADNSSSTAVCIAVDGRYAGSIYLDDTVKPHTADTIDRLHRLGINNIVILSGDREEAVSKIAETVGADSYKALLMPDDKHRIVGTLRSQGHKVAFVGDGINDAPSLALADVGIAIGTGGTDVAMESADAVITGNSLDTLVDAYRLSRRIKRVVAFNVSLAIGVKVLVMALGALGIASLWAAVFADTGITIITVALTLLCLSNSEFSK